MKYKCNLHKNKVYISPRPKEDIKDGLIIVLNRARDEKSEPFMKTNIEANKKEYKLPELEKGFYVMGAFIKYNQKETQVSECCEASYYQLGSDRYLSRVFGKRYVCKKCYKICSVIKKKIPPSMSV